MINLNGSKMSGVYFGGNEIEEAYLGNELVYHKPGTFVDVLFKAINVTAAPKSGVLSKSIYDYDMIKIFPCVNSQGEQYWGTEYAPKDLVINHTTPHIFKTQGGGNIYLQDLKIKFPTETTFNYQNVGSYYTISSTMGDIGSTAVFNKAPSNWSTADQGISMIIGINYYGTRDLLYSGTSMTSVYPLINSIENYDRLQIKISNPNANSANSIYEYAGYWGEYKCNVGKNCRMSYVGGEGGNCYLYQRCGTFTTTTSLSAGFMKPLVWNVTTNSGPGVSPNYSANYTVTEIWGVK